MATTFLNLTLPVVTVTLGPTWANQLNAALEVVDLHDHTSGKGVQIPTAGLNINENLDFQSNKAFSLYSSQFINQASALTGASNAGSVYMANGNLYFTNNSGVAIQLTDGGAIASTPGSAQILATQAVSSDLVISNTDDFVYLIVDTTASRTITLPLANTVANGRIYIVKDKDGLANTNNITINVTGADTIDGQASLVINSSEQAIMLSSDGISAYYIG